MDGWLWLGGGLAAAGTMLWSWLQLLITRLSSLVIVRLTLEPGSDDELFVRWCYQEASPDRFNQPVIRPSANVVGGESVGILLRGHVSDVRPLFWYRRAPVWLEGRDRVLCFFRFTVNREELLESVRRQASFQIEQYQKYRYHVARAYGTGRSMLSRLGGGGPDVFQRSGDQSPSPAVPSPVHLPPVPMHRGSEAAFARSQSAKVTREVSLVLTPEQQAFADECERWYCNGEWYRQRQLAWRLGALLYGPGGTGKTSFVRKLARRHGLPVTVFDLASLTNEELQQNWQILPHRAPCVALLEDVDNVFHKRKPAEEHITLTFDALLNTLDGIEPVFGLLVVMTANDPEKLDSALIRPGRIDRRIAFGDLSEDLQREMLKQRLPEFESEWPDVLALAKVRAAEIETGVTGAVLSRVCDEFGLKRFWELDHKE